MSAKQPSHLPAPLIANARNQLLYSLLQQLDESQWWSPEQMAAGQLQQLQRLLSYAAQYSPFYKQRLAGLDLTGLGWEEFHSLPVLTRAELQEHKLEIDCGSLPESHGTTFDILTSGSTATPVRLKGSGLTSMMWDALNMREQLWHARELDKVMSAIRWHSDPVALPPDGTSFPDWGYPINQFYRTGQGHVLNSSADTSDQLQWLRTIRPHYLMTHPSNLKSLLRFVETDPAAFERLLQVRTVGEKVESSLREAVSNQLGIKLVDFYSSQELGYIALQCPQHDHYHVQAESVVVEVVRDDGSPCTAGETGRLLLTSLRNYASPLIRYDIGDFAVPGNACACGRGLPVISRVTGRVRNMLRLPNGEQRWPNFGFRHLMNVMPIRQFQVVQRRMDLIELRIVTAIEPDAEAEEAAKRILVDHLGYPFSIQISYHDSLPRGAGGKFEDFVSLLDPD